MASLNNMSSDILKYNNIDAEINKPIKEYIEFVANKRELKWSNYKTFWPPRLLNALKNNILICFFGAGLSMPCGLPSWDSLLRSSLGINKDFLEDDSAKNDPLTQAELASHRIGTEKVQEIIRESVCKTNKPSLNHYILATFKLKYYITSNYDCLFEKAWDEINGNTLKVILNDSDLYTYFENGDINIPKDNNAHYLFKIHGCTNRRNELLILTRSDYRKHYRSNLAFFRVIVEKIFASYHCLFLGFSHKDPEITRLVEDSIWLWENDRSQKEQPNFYSLQFDMKHFTPEIFAARGIVALDPPLVIPKDSALEMRSYSLAHALIDLHAMVNYVNVDEVSLEADMDRYFEKINSSLNVAIQTLEKYKDTSIDCLVNGNSNFLWMQNLLEELGVFAGQGVYLLDEAGSILHYEIDAELKLTRETILQAQKSFDDRPYFQQSRTFRNAFISDLYQSKFNELATFSVCLPIIYENVFKGLLFSACQIGQWQEPVSQAVDIINKKRSVILVDSNGVCLFPPNKEFSYETEDYKNEKRTGYLYDDLLVLSRRDRLVNRIMENLVPLGKDDDVLSLSGDIKYYSLVREMSITRWKLTISSTIILAKK